MKYFDKELKSIDKWKDLRCDLFRNEEPEIKLVAVTTPVEEFLDKGITIETLPAFTARQSHESKGTYTDDLRLNRRLIEWGHDTPMQAVQFVYHVTGISKSLAGQWTRHKIGIGWTFRSTRYVKASSNTFVYPALEYIDSRDDVGKIYKAYEEEHRHAMDVYDRLSSNGVKNQELRRLMPVGWATSTYVYTNARSLRHFFKLRLARGAEWEIRRFAYILFNKVMEICPSLFEDLAIAYGDQKASE
ncbi:MAG: FAD-dependent thymidylate synthase [Deltaproteobacteria bacterium]|nr:FAD-dependent thymidylate synthase [Deltaproteobacteria bacterium]